MHQHSRNLVHASLILALGSWAAPAVAATRVVDQDGQATASNCDAANGAFMSIGAAVAAAVGGDTIVICPGTAPYDEQVVINKALTVKGFAKTSVVIRPTPMVANTTSLYSGGPIAAVVVVMDTTATLTNLVVDGGGADLGGSDCSAPNIVGIYYRNASGTINDSTARHLRLLPGLEGCQAGLGIFVQSGAGGTSTVTVDGVSVHNYQKNGIVANEEGTTVIVKNALVAGDGPTNGAVQNGIQFGFSATGTVTASRIIDQIYSPCTHPYVPGGGCDTGSSFGIIIFDAGNENVKVNNNTIGNTQAGIYIGGGIIQAGTNGAEVLSNNVFATHVFQGIVIIGDGNYVNNNTITNSDGPAVFISGNNNLVTANRIQEAPLGIWNYSGTGNTYPVTGAGRNPVFNVDVATSGGSLLRVQSTATAQTTSTVSHTPAPGRF